MSIIERAHTELEAKNSGEDTGAMIDILERFWLNGTAAAR
jgi:hypothetical protein